MPAPSVVADELAALRANGSVRVRKSSLLSAGGGSPALLTPEAEAAALKAKREYDKLGNMRAREILSRGSSAYAAQATSAAAQLASGTREKRSQEAGRYSNRTWEEEAEPRRGTKDEGETAGGRAKSAAPQDGANTGETTAVEPKAPKKDCSTTAVEREEPAPVPLEKKGSASVPVEGEGPAHGSPVSVATEVMPIDAARLAPITKKGQTVSDATYNELDPPDTESADDALRRVEAEDETTESETSRRDDSEDDDDDDDEEYRDFLKFLKS